MKKEHRLVIENIQRDVSMKFGPLSNEQKYVRNFLEREINGHRKLTVNPIDKAFKKSSKRTKMRSCTNELIHSLINHAPLRTGYGILNMFNGVNKTQGIVCLGTIGAKPGQMANAPYMVHLNSPTNSNNTHHVGWIEDSIDSASVYVNALGFDISYPEYEYGFCSIYILNEGGDF